MNRKKIVFLIVLLSIAAILLISFMIMVICGNLKNFNFSFNFGKNKSETIAFEGSYELEDIDNIYIKSDAGDIKVERSTSGKVEVVIYAEKDAKVESNLDNRKLEINSNANNKKGFFKWGNNANEVVVFVPENYDKEINISNDYGECTIGDFENSNIKLKANCGDIKIGEIKGIDATCNYGNIKIGTVYNKCDIKADYGNIVINNVQIKENSSIKANCGNIDIKEVNDICIDSQANLGSSKIHKNNESSDIILSVTANCGNIDIAK